MQLFLLGFIIIEICEIFTVGGFPLDDAVRKVGMVISRLETSVDGTSRDSPPSISLPLLLLAGFFS